MISAPFLVRDFTITLHYPGWWAPRIEHLADGTTVVYFGIGKACWR